MNCRSSLRFLTLSGMSDIDQDQVNRRVTLDPAQLGAAGDD
jgi:hypothetical protein